MIEKVLTSFKSRRNEVTLIEREGERRVRKRFANTESLIREAEVLTMLDGVSAPHLLLREGDTLFLEYIEGELFLERYLNAEASEIPSLAAMLAQYIVSFRNRTRGFILHDLNFRNFIINNGSLIGLDFEQAGEGELIESVSKAAAFAAMYIINSHANALFVETLRNSTGISELKFQPYYESELAALTARWESKRI